MSITVRRATPKDAAAYARIMGEAPVYAGLMQMPYTSEHLWAGRLEDSCAVGRTDLLLVAERGAEVVGTSGLHPVGTALRRRHVVMLGISVASAAQRQGVGGALMAAMCEYADRWLAVLRIELTVYADNHAAIALYRKFGFVVEGMHRGYAMRDGAFADALAMARLHPNPPSLAWPAATPP